MVLVPGQSSGTLLCSLRDVASAVSAPVRGRTAFDPIWTAPVAPAASRGGRSTWPFPSSGAAQDTRLPSAPVHSSSLPAPTPFRPSAPALPSRRRPSRRPQALRGSTERRCFPLPLTSWLCFSPLGGSQQPGAGCQRRGSLWKGAFFDPPISAEITPEHQSSGQIRPQSTLPGGRQRSTRPGVGLVSLRADRPGSQSIPAGRSSGPAEHTGSDAHLHAAKLNRGGVSVVELSAFPPPLPPPPPHGTQSL